MTIAADETQNEGGAPQHVGERAGVEAGQARVAGRVIEQGHSSPLMMLSFSAMAGDQVVFQDGIQLPCLPLEAALGGYAAREGQHMP